MIFDILIRILLSSIYCIEKKGHFHRVIRSMQWKSSHFLILLLVHVCTGQQPADKDANAKTKQVLQYIAGLSQQGNCRKKY